MKLKALTIKKFFGVLISSFALFWYVYSPNSIYFPVSIDKFLLIGFLIWAVLWHRHELMKLLSRRDVFVIFALYSLIFIYTFALDLMIIDGIGISYHVSQYVLQYIPFTIFLFIYMSSIFGEECLDKLFKILLVLVFLQSILGLMMFINPDLKAAIYSIQAKDGDIFKGLGLITRGNGYASGLLFSIPILHGVIVATLLLSRTEMSTATKTVFVVLVTAIAITNARMALVPIIIAMPFIALRFFSTRGFIANSKGIITATLLVILIYIIVPANLISEDMFNSISRISDRTIGGYANIFGIEISGNNERIGEYLLYESTYVDDSLIALIFGTGENAFTATVNQSDIGIINLIRFGGFLFLGAVLFVTYYLVIKAWRMASNPIYKILILLLGLSYFAASLKGIVFTEQLMGRFLIMICLFAILDRIKYSSIRHENALIR